MKVTFTQSGGFAGLVRGCEVSPADLPADQGEELAQLVAAAKFDEPRTKNPNARDQFQYDLEVKDGRTTQKYTFTDSTLPPSVGPLIAFLRQRSGPKPLT